MSTDEFKKILSLNVKNSAGNLVALTPLQIDALINAGVTKAMYDADTSPNRILNLVSIFDNTVTTKTTLPAVANIIFYFMMDRVTIPGTNKIQGIHIYTSIIPSSFIPTFLAFLKAWNTVSK